MAGHTQNVPSLNTGGEGLPQCTDNDHGINTNYEDMLSVCKCPR